MKKYIVIVNGTSYEVEVEEIGGQSEGTVQASAPSAVKPAPSAAAPAEKQKPSVPSGSVTVSAPMPGNILKINIQQGQTVKKGDVLCILEAMKMENEIMSPADGTVVSVNVQKGSSVNTGDILFSLS